MILYSFICSHLHKCPCEQGPGVCREPVVKRVAGCRGHHHLRRPAAQDGQDGALGGVVVQGQVHVVGVQDLRGSGVRVLKARACGYYVAKSHTVDFLQAMAKKKNIVTINWMFFKTS